MPTNVELVLLAVSQAGDQYVFGAEASPSDSNPYAFDCSELVQWSCDRIGVQPPMPDGSWIQYQHCDAHLLTIPPAEAIGILGALLFWFDGDPRSAHRPNGAHVAISIGDGRTIEARSAKYGVGIFSVEDRGWTHGGLIPGLEYRR
jgi:cell wall-associated NlpC family hydrolase